MRKYRADICCAVVPVLARSRLALLGSPTIDNLTVLSNLKIESLIKFSKRINIFDQNPQ